MQCVRAYIPNETKKKHAEIFLKTLCKSVALLLVTRTIWNLEDGSTFRHNSGAIVQANTIHPFARSRFFLVQDETQVISQFMKEQAAPLQRTIYLWRYGFRNDI